MISNRAGITRRAAQIEGFDAKRETQTPAAADALSTISPTNNMQQLISFFITTRLR